ncbi:MarR family winged helix-turn-helix transcriptional regulator [Bacillus methanolicus]|uniref:HTH-type transcriptional regulator SarZ n=1 Tax=Bacillus methanolicus (strain MGA3 / ATCC 53907) TaxID=796606 RepID=I3E7V7_BACMM|nr:MarR family transcriptional regulator [Bacillus methanolicus]AIE59395.1 hypothetical protein BMMGA3_04815 [Bacillus methanolicus MGA3]EIJ82578.1 MarR family transcriptional regulator [Bacillus methanolicus MGA3]UQD51470.1 MarR family transcriptional regulator [Bacillus methanolicus]
MVLTSNTKQISESFIRLIPLFYSKLNKSVTKNTPIPKPSGLTHLQFHILEELFYTKDGVSLTQLAQNISISKQQLTPLIKKLEEKDYVIKVQDTNDKRFVKIMLTEKGKNTVIKRLDEFHHLFCNWISKLNEDDLFDLDYAINKIIRILEKLD